MTTTTTRNGATLGALPRRRAPRARLLLAAAAVATLAATAGCSGSDSSGDRTSNHRADPSAAASSQPAESSDRAADGPDATDGTDGTAKEAPRSEEGGAKTDTDRSDTDRADTDRAEPQRVEPDGPAVIATGTVSLESDDVGKTRFAVRKIVDRHQGAIADQETSTGDEGEVENARLVVRVPSDAFEDATAELEKVATLTASTSAAEDVSSEIVDVDSRVRSQRKSVARIEALLARAKDLSEVVSIESQLATRQADLDSLLSRQKKLADQTSYSTITVHIERADAEKKDEKGDTDDAAGFVDGLKDGWNAFVGALAVALTALGFVLPWLLLLVVLGAPVWLLLRRRPRRTTTVPPPPVTS